MKLCSARANRTCSAADNRIATDEQLVTTGSAPQHGRRRADPLRRERAGANDDHTWTMWSDDQPRSQRQRPRLWLLAAACSLACTVAAVLLALLLPSTVEDEAAFVGRAVEADALVVASTYFPGTPQSGGSSQSVTLSYEVDGQPYLVKKADWGFDVGTVVELDVDPLDPEQLALRGQGTGTPAILAMWVLIAGAFAAWAAVVARGAVPPAVIGDRLVLRRSTAAGWLPVCFVIGGGLLGLILTGVVTTSATVQVAGLFGVAALGWVTSLMVRSTALEFGSGSYVRRRTFRNDTEIELGPMTTWSEMTNRRGTRSVPDLIVINDGLSKSSFGPTNWGISAADTTTVVRARLKDAGATIRQPNP